MLLDVLPFTTLCANSVDDKSVIFSLFFSENRVQYSCKLSPLAGDNLHEMSDPVFWEKKKKNISICRLMKILPRVLSLYLVYYCYPLYSER